LVVFSLRDVRKRIISLSDSEFREFRMVLMSLRLCALLKNTPCWHPPSHPQSVCIQPFQNDRRATQNYFMEKLVTN